MSFPDPARDPSPPTTPTQGALDELVGYALRRAQLRLYDALHTTLAQWDMTPAKFSALTIIGANPGLKATALADALGIARSGVVVLLNRLQGMGYVMRSVADGDRRTLALDLTPAGADALEAMRQAVHAHDRHATRHLDDGERRLLLSMLGRIG